LSRRANNIAENRLSNLGSNHPVIWKFIYGIKKMQNVRDVYYGQLIAGVTPNQKLFKSVVLKVCKPPYP